MGEDFMADKMPERPYASLLPISTAAEVYRDRRRGRRGGLWRHNHIALELDGAGRHAIAMVLNGHTPDVRCDRPKRMRGLQIEGTETLGTEDLFAMALESDLGRDAVLAFARVLLASVGWRAVPNDAPDAPGALLMAGAAAAREGGEFFAVVAEAQADGHIDENENAEIQKRAHRLSQNVQIAARVAANEAAKGRR